MCEDIEEFDSQKSHLCIDNKTQNKTENVITAPTLVDRFITGMKIKRQIIKMKTFSGMTVCKPILANKKNQFIFPL